MMLLFSPIISEAKLANFKQFINFSRVIFDHQPDRHFTQTSSTNSKGLPTANWLEALINS
jgi:hypothetical protein